MSADGGFQPGGDILSRYRLQDRIGEGSLGVVYRAERIEGGDPVAIKFLRTCRSRERVGPVLEDLTPLVGLEHKHLVLLAEVGKEGVPCLVYELLQGASLARLLTKHERLAPAAALRIARGLADGLAFLHEKGLPHGALSTSNVLLDRQGKAKLADLGWGRLATLAEAEAPPPGDPLRVAREEVRELVALLFEMLVGRPPTEGSSQLSALLADVPADLDTLVKRGLEGEFQDAASLHGRVAALLKDKAIGGRKTAYEPLSERVLSSGSRPAPAMDGGGDLESGSTTTAADGRRRRSDVLLAVGGAQTRPKPRIPGLKVDTGERHGPTLGQMILVALLGFGAVGGLAYYSQQQLEEEPEKPPHLIVPGGSSDRPGIDNLDGRGQDTGSAAALSKAIVDEKRTAERMKLVQRLLEEYPGRAAEQLALIIRGGNNRLKGQLLPILGGLDQDGSLRIQLLRRASDTDGDWPLKLALSLARDGHQRAMGQALADRDGPGALVGRAGSTYGQGEVPLELAAIFERVFFEGELNKRKPVLGRWMLASGGAAGPVAGWVAEKLLARVKDQYDRMEVLESLAELEPNLELLSKLEATVERLSYGWNDEASQAAFALMLAQAGEDREAKERVLALRRKLLGY